jgi:hypothetical protein
MEVVLSVSFLDYGSFLNTRCKSGLHIANVQESAVHCDHMFGIHVSGDSGVLFENKAKYMECY